MPKAMVLLFASFCILQFVYVSVAYADFYDDWLAQVEESPTETQQEQASYDIFSDWSRGLDDFFSGLGRYKTCAQEGEILDYREKSECCSGLQEKYDAYSGETICVKPQEPSRPSPTQPAAEELVSCYDDLYCKYFYGSGWLCDFSNNRCYYAGIPAAETEFEPQPIAEQPELGTTTYPITEGESLVGGVFPTVAETGASKQQIPQYSPIPIKPEIKKVSQTLIQEKKYNYPKVDIVFVPFNYRSGEDKEFRDDTLFQLDYFRKISPQSCLPTVDFIQAAKCKQLCDSHCCREQALECAIENGYIFAKRIVAVVKSPTTLGTGCADTYGVPGRVVSVIADKVDARYLSHELGHAFALCHVLVYAPDCGAPLACEPGCPNLLDCKPPYVGVHDIMSYCKLRSRYGTNAYKHVTSQCSKLSASATQQVLAAYVTISRYGTATLNSVHIVEDSLDEEEGDYVLAAYDDGRQLASEDFNVQFSVHADLIDESGNMYSELVELNEVSAIVKLPYSPEMDEIKITHSGQLLLAADLSDFAHSGNMFAVTSEGSKQLALLPEEAAMKADIREINNIELVETEGEPVYSIEGTKQGGFFFIPWEATVFAKIDAANGELLAFEKPWWFWG